MEWYWLAEYAPRFAEGLWLTLQLLGLSIFFGMALAIPIGLVQVTGPWPLAWAARAFCTVIRGTPLLIQLWLIYYGLGSLFPFIPGIRDTMIWPLLREAFPYAVFAFSLSVAGYEGEVMRGAFRGVPRGELEAARAMGMSPFTVLRRIWLPRALQNVFPTLAGEFILTLKATPLAATITVFEVYGVGTIVRQETYRIYEPLLFVAAIYLCLTFVLVIAFRLMERRMPRRTA
ncbi:MULTISPECIES: ABC transporter permease [unclassified Epibacterium]|uniref:ABC transporter permease n=1 Tax=unclassified Epibacterium TaxID=2639179 RepID=UPI001EF40E26|nr:MULTISPECIES: ABC transporter permease subunit [unclassified Epibacterium]MCG7624436.1 ABC transporter permease subunit [Epibacterium sp. Ofav1-8]MCG7627919.1 ABC transporter permease subunit [Epibacterium sp. MM17-32]